MSAVETLRVSIGAFSKAIAFSISDFCARSSSNFFFASSALISWGLIPRPLGRLKEERK
jgi:hypothetical protein